MRIDYFIAIKIVLKQIDLIRVKPKFGFSHWKSQIPD